MPTARKAEPDAVEAELRAQLETAYGAGIDATHLDAHMGAAQMPEFVTSSAGSAASAGCRFCWSNYDKAVAVARADGEPIFETVFETP